MGRIVYNSHFIDEVRTKSARFAKRIEHLKTEEATKNALVLPFFEMLGYGVYDPTQVVPEFTADFGTKKRDKVDYALLQDGTPIIVIECKMYGTNLDDEKISQLYQYFAATTARFAILTDGIVYRFFSDFDEPNKMDRKPFFEFNMLAFNDAEVEQLKHFTKSAFHVIKTVDAARELKYTTEIKRMLADELAGPSEEFVKFTIKRIYERPATQAVKEQFSTLVRQAFVQFINDRINTRLQSALEREDDQPPRGADDESQFHQPSKEDAEFTLLELEALQIVKAILRDLVAVRRIGMRSARDYCSVILDDSNRKKICRLRLKTNNLRLGLFDREEHEERVQLRDLDSIFSYADRLRSVIAKVTLQSAESIGEGHGTDDGKQPEGGRSILHLSGKGITAQGYVSADGFAVCADARAVKDEAPSLGAPLSTLRRKLLSLGVLKEDGDSYRLVQDYVFSSPSYAGAVLLGRRVNGLIKWKDESGRTLKEIRKFETK